MIPDWTDRFQGTAALPRAVRDRLIDVARIIHMDGRRAGVRPGQCAGQSVFPV